MGVPLVRTQADLTRPQRIFLEEALPHLLTPPQDQTTDPTERAQRDIRRQIQERRQRRD